MSESRLSQRFWIVGLLTLAFFVVAAAAHAGGTKVNVCHIPPGNPDNFHTIVISENALNAHLSHGDLAGTCAENCEFLCDDGDPCTQDVDPQGVDCVCLTEPVPVDCDDSNACTTDYCDPVIGACVNVVTVDCSDGDLCTVDQCDPLTGNCLNTPVVCDPGEVCDPATGQCVVEGPSNCCEGHGGLGCDDPECEAAVCALDDFCCLFIWDVICASTAVDLCPDLCG